MSMDIYGEIYKGLGEASSIGLSFTRQAFQMLPELDQPRILDVGCGQGRATLELARLSSGQVVGLDIDQAALEVLSRRIEEERLSGHVQVVHGSMLDMDFPDECFDIIWAEGTLNVIGFEKGLREWRPLIKPDGFLVVHEGAWLQPNPPQAIVDRWQPVFPEISTLAEYVAQLPRYGYRLIGYFALPQDFWWLEFYALVEARIHALRHTYAGDQAAQQVLDQEQREVDLYHAHRRWYGSAFLVTQKSQEPVSPAGACG